MPNFAIYNVFLEKEAKGEINLATATIKVALVHNHTAAGISDISAQKDVNNLAGFTGGYSGSTGFSSSAHEFDGMAYTRGTLAGQAVARDDASNVIKLTGTDQTFASLDNDGLGYGIGGVLLIAHVDGTDANDYPIAFLPFEKTPSGADVVVAWPSTGILFKKQSA